MKILALINLFFVFLYLRALLRRCVMPPLETLSPPEIRVGEYFTSGLFCLQRKHLAHDYFVNIFFFFHGEELLALRPTPSWRTTPCRLSTTAYSIYSQLPSISEAVPPSANRGRVIYNLLILNVIILQLA